MAGEIVATHEDFSGYFGDMLGTELIAGAILTAREDENRIKLRLLAGFHARRGIWQVKVLFHILNRWVTKVCFSMSLGSVLLTV